MPPLISPNPQAIGTSRSQVWEKTAVILLILLIVALKLSYINSLFPNSDEPQHLHVAWGWTQGMVQYRDYFDNHTPLFHLMMAPLVKRIGQRADIVFRMRLAMLPLWALSLGCIGWLGTRLYSRRVGLWATLLAATCPTLLITGSEFRADILWMAGWLLTLTVGLTGRFTRGRALAFGLLLGTTFGVSMKTSLLLVSLLSALGLLFLLLPGPERKILLEQSGSKLLLALGGLCVVPLAIAAFFAKRKALPALFYCVFQHNARAGSHAHGVQFWIHLALFPLLLLILIWAARAFLPLGPDWKQAARRALVLLTPAFFLLYLFCFWPLITRQDFLPPLPLLAIPLAACLNGRRSSWQLLILVAILQVGAAAGYKQPFRPRNLRSQTLVEDILKLTHRHDFVMDAKGETIFRNRPYYFCLESITRTQLLRGGIPDTIAERMAATRTCVSLPSRFPTQSAQWVRRFYLPVTDQIWVAGCSLPALPPHPPAAPLPGRPFEVGIAASYLVESASGPVQGTMDGLPCNGPVFLNPGPHLFTCNDPRTLDVIWSRAVKKGFKPLNLCP